jgi:hypothetical protein
MRDSVRVCAINAVWALSNVLSLWFCCSFSFVSPLPWALSHVFSLWFCCSFSFVSPSPWALSHVLSLWVCCSFSFVSPSPLRHAFIGDIVLEISPLFAFLRLYHLVATYCFIGLFALQVRVEGPRSARETAVGLLCRIFLAHGQSGVCGSALGSEFNSEESFAMTPVSLNKVRRSVRLMMCPPLPCPHSILVMFVLASSYHNLHL